MTAMFDQFRNTTTNRMSVMRGSSGYNKRIKDIREKHHRESCIGNLAFNSIPILDANVGRGTSSSQYLMMHSHDHSQEVENREYGTATSTDFFNQLDPRQSTHIRKSSINKPIGNAAMLRQTTTPLNHITEEVEDDQSRNSKIEMDFRSENDKSSVIDLDQGFRESTHS